MLARWIGLAVLIALLSLVALGFYRFRPASSPQANRQRLRVLITNDNGIDDARIAVLARAFAPLADTFVVASAGDRSGSSNYMPAVRSGKFRVQRRNLGPSITAYALDGNPADCVVFALTALMKDAPPDLVVSGINGGANLADDWFGSGTIGAARTATYFGIPAIAVSGLSSDADSMNAAAKWVVELAQSAAVRALRPPQYLTISLPPVPQIKGVRVVRRASGLARAAAKRVGEQQSWEEWTINVSGADGAAPDTDVVAVAQGFIAVVPMQVDESAPQLAEKLGRDAGSLPSWTAPTVSASGCKPGFGATVDDAEDASGREWGVLIETVVANGPAALAGFRAGDVIVAADGQSLASGRGEPDPDEKFVALLQKLCGKKTTFTVRRGNQDLTISMAF